ARRVPVIETLGSATVLCVDKTGTLTVNRRSIRKLAGDGTVLDVEQQATQALPEEFHEIVEFGILASQRDPFDPMEKAFHDLGNARLAQTEHLHADWTLERGYSLSPTLLAMSHVWNSPGACLGNRLYRANSTTLPSSSWASWVWPTLFVRPSPPLLKSATRRAS